ncbi:MAG: MBL fold metallo-hydrolase [Bacteroidota bacterium]
MELYLTHIDTACCLLEIEGYKILTDPVLDEAGGWYHHGFGAISKKTQSPKLENVNLDDVQLVLLSHPQHKDNFDHKGKEFAAKVPLILSTPAIERQFAHGKGMQVWETFEIELPSGGTLRITATPAQHHPHWLPTFVSGHVIGFVVEHSEWDTCLYISGDTIFYKGIQEIKDRFPHISHSLIHVGSAEFRYLAGLGKFTMDAKGFMKTVEVLAPSVCIPIHNGGWTHFKENDEGLRKEMGIHSSAEKVHMMEKGKRTLLTR